MSIIDAVSRKLPGALGNVESLDDESFSEGLDGDLEYPHFTRPAEFRGWTVPEVLQGGHHAEIDAWRARQSAIRTQARRGTPDS
jgi:tRNA (guanine37-N1)-methyltransferase